MGKTCTLRKGQAVNHAKYGRLVDNLATLSFKINPSLGLDQSRIAQKPVSAFFPKQHVRKYKIVTKL